ncbi:MAG: hypothetical protein SD837_05535 [Candidatus Electrothrix scaldis]|nr:MAG: hypothetical protein SD837_05535 [Candidatus Electrothrix sp. GW3-3]
MKKSWRHFLLTNTLATLASCTVSAMIIIVSHYCAFGLFCLILGPLSGGFLAAYLVLYLLEEKDEIHLLQDSWQTLLLGTTMALIVTGAFICAISQHLLFSPAVFP